MTLYNCVFKGFGLLLTQRLASPFPSLSLSYPNTGIMRVASGSGAAPVGPSCALKASKTPGGAGEVVRCLSEQSWPSRVAPAAPGRAFLPYLMSSRSTCCSMT